MIQQYKINIIPNFTGNCVGPTEPVTGTVEVCPGNPVIRIDCYSDLDQCVQNYVEVEIQEQCSCQEGLEFCGGSNTFEVDVDLTCGCEQFTCTDYAGQYNFCPGGQMFDDGCGGEIDCGTTCNGDTIPPTGQDTCIEGNCVCQPYCGEDEEEQYTCGDDGCNGYCGTCADVDPCTYCPEDENYCTPYPTDMFWDQQPIPAFELGNQDEDDAADFSISWSYRGILEEDGPFQIYFVNQDDGVQTLYDLFESINYSCNTYDTITQNLWNYQINRFFNDNSLPLGNYKILIQTANNTGTNPSLLSNVIQITDDFILGCTDSCATNYNPNATIDNGCIYTQICTDELANNWFCLIEGCDEGAYCTGIAGTDYVLATDGGDCTFDPVAFIDEINETLYEGNQITIVGNNSLPMTPDSDYDTSPTITGYSWNVFDTEGRSWNGTGSQIGFTIPLYTDPTQEYGGGGRITAELTVTNSQGFTNTYSRDFLIGDIDILATQLSEFDSIYIPGDMNPTLIGCYLPPKEDGDYNLLETFQASFYNVATNPDNTDDGNLVSGTFNTGDIFFVKLCIGEPCEGENLLQTSFTYFGNGLNMWLGGNPDIPLVPGMGFQVQLNNGGWFQWTIPSDE